jgi:hypothetical protein
MTSWFEGPKLEPNMAVVALILCILFPGIGEIIVGAIAKPSDKDAITVGIVMIIANLLFFAVVVFLILGVISALTFGFGAILYIAWPLSYFGFLIIWIWSCYFGYKTFVKSKAPAPFANTMTTQQPQQPQEEIQQEQLIIQDNLN